VKVVTYDNTINTGFQIPACKKKKNRAVLHPKNSGSVWTCGNLAAVPGRSGPKNRAVPGQ